MAFFLGAFSQVHVRGYYRSNGTYVQPHYRSNPDGNPYNNWSYPGNVNPYTGKVATGNPETYLDNYYNRNNTSGNSRTTTTSPTYKNYYITASNAYARTGPAASYPVLTTLNYMDKVEVISTSDDVWYYARIYYYDRDRRVYKGDYAYILSSFLTTSKTGNGNVSDAGNSPNNTHDSYTNPQGSSTYDVYYVTAGKLYARTGPSALYPVLTTLSYRDKVEVISAIDAPWYYARIYYYDTELRIYKGSFAYVHSSFLTASQPSGESNATPGVTTLSSSSSSTYQSAGGHPFGEGNGKITVYTTCASESHIYIFADDDYVGQLTSFTTRTPECGAYGTISITKPNGMHKITAVGSNRKWEFYVTIEEDRCQVQELAK